MHAFPVPVPCKTGRHEFKEGTKITGPLKSPRWICSKKVVFTHTVTPL